MYCSKDNVNTLTALLVAHGVRHVVVCPGSRNAPLVHNFCVCPDVVCHSATDERSAAFLALGLRHGGSPVAVCVTSGSALLNTLPAVAEATYQRQGIIIISADRPAAWIDQLDGQTLPQPGALGAFVGHVASIPEPHDDTERWHCNRLINEALLLSAAPPYPSVHINVPISEPLFAFSTHALPAERTVRWGVMSDLAALTTAERPMIVVGQLPPDALPGGLLTRLAQSMAVLTEPLSSAELLPSYTDQMLYTLRHKADGYVPDCVLYVGGHTVSKRLRQFLRAADTALHIAVTDDGRLRDISQHTSILIKGVAADVLAAVPPRTDTVFRDRWEALRRRVAQRHAAYEPQYSQLLAVKRFEESIVRSADTVYYANSMAVRLAAIFAHGYRHCNRGLNGIEGSLSVAAGASLGREGRVWCVIGDLSFFYDENALWQQQLTGNLRILLLNNGGGAIFRNLRGLEASPARDTYVAAAHTATAEGVCRQFGLTYLRATDTASLSETLPRWAATESQRPVLLEVVTDAETDSETFKHYYHELDTDARVPRDTP